MVCEALAIFFKFSSSVAAQGTALKQHKMMQLQHLPREAPEMSNLVGLMNYKIRMIHNA